MLPRQHIVMNLALSIFLIFFVNPIYVLIFFLSSFLIDVDHYLYYVFEKKKISLKSSYNWFIIKRNRFIKLSKEERMKHKHPILIFHGIEPLLILLLISVYSPLFMFVFAGFAIHLTEDLVEARKYKLFKYKLSIIYQINKHSKK